jgi:NitT/TauT family transport system permease protein
VGRVPAAAAGIDPAEGSWLAWALSGELMDRRLGSMYRVVVGFLIGAGLALPLGPG